MNKNEQLFWKIYSAFNEDELHEIVTNDPLLSSHENWKPYGGENNFSTFENQQSNAIAALVEKITNSVDALLLKQCLLHGIDPKSKSAPRTMQQAVEVFYGIKNGDFSEVLSAQRRTVAQDIQVLATGDNFAPNITVYDNGEGQHPDDFTNTFLSLHRGNKTSIQFVQGKYNMGSTGAVVFCGRHRYQLIASKRQDDLTQGNTRNPIGFTLVRRHPLNKEEEAIFRATWYEYFVIGNNIPSFESSALELGLSGRNFNSGSVVKMFSYQLPRGTRSDITLDLWRELNQFLYQPALPFILYEKRNYKSKTPDKPVLGNKTRIFLDEREKKEHPTLTFSVGNNQLGRVSIEATVFKPSVEQREFIGEKPVIFTVNGQAQGWLPRRFISQELGYSMLRDSMLIHVDCTNILTSFRQDLFMASRDRLKESENTEILKEKVIQTLKGNETLRDLNQKRKSQLLHESGEDREILEKILSTIPIDKDLLDLLKKNGDLSFLKRSGTNHNGDKSTKKDEEKHPYSSKRYPSIFKIDLKQNMEGRRLKSIPLNGKGIIKFETDVEDEYLFRPDERGELKLQILGWEPNDTTGGTRRGKPSKVEDILEVTREGPSDNVIRITFEPKEDVNVGDEIELSAKLTSPSGDLQTIFWVKIVDPQREEKKPEKKVDNPALPRLIRVFEKPENAGEPSWAEYGFSGDDVVKVLLSDEPSQLSLVDGIAINMDSFAVRRHISRKRITSQKQIRQARDKYCMTTYLHSLFLYAILDKLVKSEEHLVDLDASDFVRDILKPYSSFLLSVDTNDAIIESLKDD